MEKLIEKLFNLHNKMEEISFPEHDKEEMNREIQLYDFLYESMSEQNHALFLEYIRIRERRQAQDVQVAYEQGFKTAIKLIFEALKE